MSMSENSTSLVMLGTTVWEGSDPVSWDSKDWTEEVRGDKGTQWY